MSLDLRDLADAALDVCTDDPEEFSQGELSFPESQEYQPFYSRTHSPFTQTPLIVSDLSQTPLALPLPAIMTPMGLTSFFCAPLLHFLFFFPDLNLAMLPRTTSKSPHCNTTTIDVFTVSITHPSAQALSPKNPPTTHDKRQVGRARILIQVPILVHNLLGFGQDVGQSCNLGIPRISRFRGFSAGKGAY